MVLSRLFYRVPFEMCEFLVLAISDELLYRAQACIQKRMIEAIKNKQSTSSVSREWTWYFDFAYFHFVASTAIRKTPPFQIATFVSVERRRIRNSIPGFLPTVVAISAVVLFLVVTSVMNAATQVLALPALALSLSPAHVARQSEPFVAACSTRNRPRTCALSLV